MNLKIKKFIIKILLILMPLSMLTTTSFADDTIDLNLYSKSCILVEYSTNKIAYEKDSNTKMYPASTTKILTAILAIENCNLTDTVTITQEMISNIPTGYTTAYLRPGEQLTIEELLNALLIPSANDAGIALAIHISGSVENFSTLMNEKAKQIGCTNSNFTNPSGIHDDNHYSTAKDMALIGTYALNYPHITDICSKTSYTLHPGQSDQRNFETTNTLIKKSENNYYEYATGLKTGYTSPAGSCIIATAQKDNMKFLVVILGAPEPEDNINYRDIDCKTLFDYGFQNYETIIKTDKQIINFLNDFFITGTALSTIFKIGLSICTIYFFYSILNKKNSGKIKKKFSEKISLLHIRNVKLCARNKKQNNTDEFKFRCSFW